MTRPSASRLVGVTPVHVLKEKQDRFLPGQVDEPFGKQRQGAFFLTLCIEREGRIAAVYGKWRASRQTTPWSPPRGGALA